MATVNLTNRFVNQNKRYAEAVVMTVPAMLETGGNRLSTPPVYTQYGDTEVAAIVEADTIIKTAFLVIDEAFPASSLIDVTIDGVTYFSAVDATVTGLTVSTTAEQLVTTGQNIEVVISGGTGDITEGSLRVSLDTDSLSIKNGNYASAQVS
jgi:hypothetical protein